MVECGCGHNQAFEEDPILMDVDDFPECECCGYDDNWEII